MYQKNFIYYAQKAANAFLHFSLSAFHFGIAVIFLYFFLSSITPIRRGNVLLSVIGSWEVYTLDTSKRLRFSHHEKYVANGDFYQWNSNFTATGQWWISDKELCVRFDTPVLTICGRTKIEDDDTFYYLEERKPENDVLVYKRQKTPANPSPTTTSHPATASPPPAPATTQRQVQKMSCPGYCYGRGYHTCIPCSGSGKETRIVYKKEYDREVKVLKEYDCPYCNGKGKKVCAACDGKGYVEY